MPTSRKRRIVRAPVRLPDETTSSAWMRSIRLSGFSALVLTLIVLFLVVLAPGLRIYLDQRQQIADLEAAVAEQESDLQALGDERARWDDPAYIRAEARDRLFYVMPGEYPYLIIDDAEADSTDSSSQAVSARLEKTDVDWTASLFSSFLAAGLSDEPAEEENE